MHWLYLGLAILAEVIATTALKAADGFSRPLPSLVVVVGYGIAFTFLSICLRTIPVGIAYAVWSGVGIIAITIIAWFAYAQKLDAAAVAGMGMIVGGVLVIQLFSKAGTH